MKLKIKEIHNIKNLNLTKSDFSKDIGLIYGMNGAGKSTIKTILKDLKDSNDKGKSNLRKAFGNESSPSSIKIELFGEEYTYDGEWDKELNNTRIVIFDTDFIHKNIYIDGKTSATTKEQLSNIIIGKENIDKYFKVIEKERGIVDKKAEIKNLIDIALDDDINITLKQLLTGIKKIESHLNNVETLKLKLIGLTTLTKHIEHNIKDSEESRAWFKAGLLYQKSKVRCPMCGQALREKERALFSLLNKTELTKEEYFELQTDFSFYTTQVKTLINEIPKGIAIGRKDHIINALDKIHFLKMTNWDSEIDLIESKTLTNLMQRLTDYENKREEIKVERDYTKTKIHIQYLESKKITTFNDVKDSINKLETLEDAKTNLNITIKKSIDDALNERLDEINKELEILSFPYDIDISETLADLKPKALKARQTAEVGIKLVYRATKDKVDESALPETLSQGEKEVLSWVLFKNDILTSRIKENLLIVLDDPIASFDEYKRFSVNAGIREIRNKIKNSAILILTHNRSMVSSFETQFRGHNSHRLQNQQLVNVERNEIVKNEYQHSVKRVLDINYCGITSENIIEFLVLTRNIIQSHRKFEKSKLKNAVDNAFDNLSRILHMKLQKLYDTTQELITNILKMHDSAFKLNPKIEFSSIDVYKYARLDLTNIYNQRILLEYYLKQKVAKSAFDKITKDDKFTVGQLFGLAIKRKRLSDDERKDFASILPILNIVNHSEGRHGLSINDLEDAQIARVTTVMNKYFRKQKHDKKEE